MTESSATVWPMFPSEREFGEYLEYERDTRFSSGMRSIFRYITAHFSNEPFTAPNFRHMLHILETDGKNGKILKRSTLNKYIELGKHLCRYLNIPILDDFRGFSHLKATPIGDFLTDDLMQSISTLYLSRFPLSSEKEREINIKHQAILTLMRFCGTPPVDVCDLKWSSDMGSHFLIERRKTGKKMIIPIVKELRILLDRLPHHPHNYIFGSEQGRMKEATINAEIRKRCKHLGIKGHITAYSFRRSMISLCYILGGEKQLVKIATISGHSIDTAMKHYVELDAQSYIDALYASHPGLVRQANIDTIKRIIMNFIAKLVDLTKFEVLLTIRPKTRDVRMLRVS